MKCISLFLLSSAALFAQNYVTGQAARLVIGQATFTAQDTNSSDIVLGGVSGLAYAGDTLFVADSNPVGAFPSNHRVLLFENLSAQLPSPTAELQYNRKCPVCLGQANVVLGQPDFVTTTLNLAATPHSLRGAAAVASDGVHLVVADTDHNRVLIWNHIPTTNDANADVVVGQKDFVSAGLPGNEPNAQSMRGPQAVWIQNGKLFVADTQNNRVLIFNHIPVTNGVAADVVLGAPNFTTFVNPDLTQQTSTATASNMLDPTSVTSDGVRLYVSDIGYNRVLIWNSIPSSNGAPADIVVGQPDMVSSISNNAYTGTAATDSADSTDKEVPVLCKVSNGTDPYGNPTYPNGCEATLNFPRFALSAAGRLFIADGGNDRVLVFQQVPTTNGASADYILGEVGGTINQASDAADSLRTPLSLAWDGANLYVSDAYNRRVTVYTIGANNIAYQAVRNAANLDITARGSLTVTSTSTIQAGDTITITINGTNYVYTVKSTDTLPTVVDGITALLNSANNGAGDPSLFAVADDVNLKVLLSAKTAGDPGNNVAYSVVVAPPASVTTAGISVTAAAANLSGGGDAANVAPGGIASVVGTNLSAGTASADPNANPLPTKLGGTEVYFNGIAAPLLYVSPTQINAQVPWELGDTTSISVYVRSEMSDGSVMVTTAMAATIVPANPGIFAQPPVSATALPVAVAYHSTSNATAIVSVDGSVTAGNVATITVAGRTYNYTAQSTDTLDTVRDALVVLINTDPQVTAKAAGLFDRIIITAKVQGPEGNGIPITATATGGPSNSSLSLTMTAFDSATCCGNIAGAPITQTNPAQPGEIIYVYATGLGVPVLTDAVQPLIQTGFKYPQGAPTTTPQEFVSSFIGGSTADVLYATLVPGMVGIYQVLLHLNSGLTTSAYSILDIAQDTFVSNQSTVPVLASGAASIAPALTVSSTHTGNFTLGQQAATFTITVSNATGSNQTAGTVTLVDTLPAGLTFVSMAGDGWTCTGTTCTRSDPLGGGSSYPVITVTVNVASNAASSVINTVKVTGGSSATATASDTVTITPS